MLGFEDVLKKRRSIRGFLPDPLSAETIEAIFDLAQASAPSNCNTQPWRVYVASGKKIEEMRAALMDRAASGDAGAPDFSFPEAFTDVHRERQFECAAELYGNLGIERSDKDGRQYQYLRNYGFFEAPHVAFLGMPRDFGVYQSLDVGIYLQTLMLCMTAHGVASCAQAALFRFPDSIRSLLGIGEDIGILLGVSFGYADPDHPANKTITSRAPLEQVVRFYS